jgi:hypothetical protein
MRYIAIVLTTVLLALAAGYAAGPPWAALVLLVGAIIFWAVAFFDKSPAGGQ